MTCPVCKFKRESSQDVFALGFVAGAKLMVHSHMPTLCEPHMRRLAAVAEHNGFSLIPSASQEEHEEKREALILDGAVQVRQAGGPKS